MLPSTYHAGLVALSVAIAMVASYAALDLAGRVTAAHGRARLRWLAGGATAMGIGSQLHFTFRTLRDRRSGPPRMTAERATLEDLQDLPVLVVDDHPINRRVLRELLLYWACSRP